MFSGIIEATGIVKNISGKGTNLTFSIHSSIATELKVDQSVAHNGVCLTVESISGDQYMVTAIAETLAKTNLGTINEGSLLNLERSISLQSRIDGHMVQGHVDSLALCEEIKDEKGSYFITFSYDENFRHLIVEKGSIALNGASLTLFNCTAKQFSVAIIPYTWKHTNFHHLKTGDRVNLEFDIIGKYVSRWMESYKAG